MRKFINISFFIIFSFSGCIEPFDASIDKYENILVIDGIITDDPGPYTVKISRSTSTDNIQYIYVSGATVIISDNDGNSEILSEIEAGVYSTSENGIQGITNNYYKIYIKTLDGNEYESEFQKLHPSTKIDSLYGNIDFQSTDGTNLLHEGYQFFIETQPEGNETQYFLWEAIETYKYYAEYKLEYYHEYDSVYIIHNQDSLYTCWRTDRIQNVFTIETTGNNKILFPLHFTSADTKKLYAGYSLLVKQYTTDYESYQYWSNIAKLMLQGESLYNIQPFQIIGNVKNINDPDEPVLGYFTAAGLSEKRIFTEELIQPTYYYSSCVPNVMRWQNAVAYNQKGGIYGVTNEDGVVGAIGGSCIDCRQNGGTLIRPDFWVNK
ncbi:MAG: DUF4249 domain-containing protein [Bacteroidales bacterium]|nr:DUF4249 domain-containing protein [Bacteroidales bacterium]